MITEEIYIKPDSVKEALDVASLHTDNFKFIAGGTDIMAGKFQGNIRSSTLIDLSGIKELKTVVTGKDFLKIGSMVKLADLNNISELKAEFPALIEAANSVGSPLIRKSATLSGNLLCENRCLYFNQSEWWRESIGKCLKCDGNTCIATGGKKICFSEFVSDTCPVLIAMDAQVEIINAQGIERRMLEDIYTGDGVFPRKLGQFDIVKSVLLPLNRNFKVEFKKLRQREGLEFTSLTSAVSKDNKGNLTIVLAGVDPGPVVVRFNENEDLDLIIKKAVKKSRAIDNDMLTRKYRKEMIKLFINQSINTLIINS